MDSHTAILSNQGEFTSFSFAGRNIRFRTSDKLIEYLEVKEWDNGYIVVTARYDGLGDVEEYIDLQYILHNLLIDADSFLKPVKKVEIKNS
ncbi:MAG: hypothetical protein HUK00_07640 [Bacteroidaceae bacterium]|nr:hypothetical protein [Bacteroidaceae bacterium]